MKLLFLGISLIACGPAAEPKLSVIQREVLTPSCTFRGCHGAVAPEADLDLRAGKSYASLINVPTEHAATRIRVVPGDPDASYLIDKIYGRNLIEPSRHEESTIMPPPDTGVMEEQWKRALSEWVARGAKDD